MIPKALTLATIPSILATHLHINNATEVELNQQGLVFRSYIGNLLIDFFHEDDSITTEAVNDIMTHGCWCGKLAISNPFLEFLGGPDPVDELDEICKNWFKCRNCNDRLQGGSCNVDGSSSRANLLAGEYTITVPVDDVDAASCSGINTCSDDTCVIDLYYMQQIRAFIKSDEFDDFLDNGPLVVQNNATCTPPANVTVTRVCGGTVPYLEVRQSEAEIFEAAIEAFVDDGWQSTGNTELPVIFKLFTQNMNWHQAVTFCANQEPAGKVSLAAVYDDDEAALVHALGATSKAWLGGNDLNSEGTWQWIVGKSGGPENMGYSNWQPGEPNQAGNEDCSEKYTSGKWNDIPCSQSKHVICQIRDFS